MFRYHPVDHLVAKSGTMTVPGDLWSDVPWKKHLVTKSGITSGQTDLCLDIPHSRGHLVANNGTMSGQADL